MRLLPAFSNRQFSPIQAGLAPIYIEWYLCFTEIHVCLAAVEARHCASGFC